MAGGNKAIRPEDGKQFSTEYQPAEKWTEKRALALGQGLIDWLKERDEKGKDKGNIFFKEFLIMEQDLYPDAIGYLCKKFSSFFDLIKKAEAIQELKLQKYGVGDRLNATMTKFVLTNIHGWRDSQNIDHTSNGEKLNPNIEITIHKPTDED